MHSVALRGTAAGFWNSKHQVGLHRDQGHETSITWLFDWPWAISYRCSICTDTLSPKDFEILRLKCMYLGHGSTFLGHVTSSVTCSYFPQYMVSYRCSIDTNPLFWAVCEILSPKHIWVATLTFRVTWRHRSRSRDHFFRGMWFPIGGPLTLFFLTGTGTEIFGCKGPITPMSSQACIFPV